MLYDWAPKAWNCSTEGEDSIKVLFSPFYMVLRTDNARVFCMVAELLWYDMIYHKSIVWLS